jgi:predicted deacylase
MADTPGWKFPNWERALEAYSELGADFAEAERAMAASDAIGKELFAEAFLVATGNVEERKSKARLDPSYRQWAKVDHPAVVEHKTEIERRLKAGEIWFRMVQTTSANVRAERNFQ